MCSPRRWSWGRRAYTWWIWYNLRLPWFGLKVGQVLSGWEISGVRAAGWSLNNWTVWDTQTHTAQLVETRQHPTAPSLLPPPPLPPSCQGLLRGTSSAILQNKAFLLFFFPTQGSVLLAYRQIATDKVVKFGVTKLTIWGVGDRWTFLKSSATLLQNILVLLCRGRSSLRPLSSKTVSIVQYILDSGLVIWRFPQWQQWQK